MATENDVLQNIDVKYRPILNDNYYQIKGEEFLKVYCFNNFKICNRKMMILSSAQIFLLLFSKQNLVNP